ncbi:MAG TPA: glycine zipper 2TM domain-containing protein [Methylophilaceae bacterium]|nr:glycine zipper 2TM domain-containing protein [Methylophilaceae bacterium]
MNKVKLIVPALMAATLSLPAMAHDEYYDSAHVLAVTPQTERVNYPVEECQTEYVRESAGSRSPIAAIIGGVTGGLLGSQIGKGNGRVAGAAVGAGVGAVVGDRISSRDQGYSERPVERCYSRDNWQTVSRGYLVTYRYNGRTYTTLTDRDPGDRIDVRVSVGPGRDAQEVAYYAPDDDGRGWDRGRKHRHGDHDRD